MMDRPESQPGFTYLTGSLENIQALADAVGYGYHRNPNDKNADPATGKFAHSAGIFVCTPYGRLSQTIQGIDFPTDQLHFALVQAADGKIGSGFLEQVELPCGAMRLGPNGYEVNPWFWAGTAGGGASILFTAVFLGLMWRGEFKKRKQGGSTTAGDPPAGATPATH